MNISEIIENLHTLTNSRIVKADLARALNVDPAALRRKELANINLKPNEIEKIENYYRVKFNHPSIYTLDRQNDVEVSDKFSQIGKRYAEIQEKHNFLDREMAQLLEISEKEYIGIKVGKKEPSITVLNNTKRNFKVSMDWLMYGEG